MKKKIALVTGGSSGELEISLNSAQIIKQNLNPALYDVFLITLTGNEWVYANSSGQNILVDKNEFTLNLQGNVVKFDCVFIAIHGTPGEDGKLQGYFDLLGIPYTACDVFTSSLTFNKLFANQVVHDLGIRTGKLMILKLDDKVDVQNIAKSVGLPCFVKPNKGGSSVGVAKVKRENELPTAIENAFLYDDEVLVQEYISGREITCGLMRYNNELMLFPLCEVVSRKEFFDYEAKYTAGMSDEIVPAPISEQLANKCRDISAFLYNALNCKGVVRFDYILNDSEFYFLEVNSIPGLSEGSIVPKMAKNMGISLRELFTMLINEAISWHGKRKKYAQRQPI